MTAQVYTIAPYLRKATFGISDHFSSIFSCLWAKQFTMPGCPSCHDVSWKRDGALSWMISCQGAQGWVG